MKHGHARRGKISRTYRAWYHLVQRCVNSNDQDYYNYGGRGILLHPAWADFSNFLRDVGECPPGLEIDRIDFNKGYEPENVRWTDQRTQSLNRRWTIWIALEEEMIPMKVAAERLGLSYNTLKSLTAPNGLYRLSGHAAIERLLKKKHSA
jgi:hypothetical protein